ncbi:unnamed protein product [Colias eurytheme]|nr:unnamed protein product [Colias eurytheme]
MARPKVAYVMSKRGGRQLIRDGYRYHLKRRNKYGYVTWRCIHRGVCNAYCIVDKDIVMIPTRRGRNIIMYKKYTFSQINDSMHWYCSSKVTGCKARIQVAPDVQFIPTEKGKYILVLKGFTYSQVGGRFFYCSSKHMGCRARVRLISGRLVASSDAHNHAPPSHARCGNGAFVQLRPRSQALTVPSIAAAILPSPLTSPRAASLALHALNFPRIAPKTDLWHRSASEEKKE